MLVPGDARGIIGFRPVGVKARPGRPLSAMERWQRSFIQKSMLPRPGPLPKRYPAIGNNSEKKLDPERVWQSGKDTLAATQFVSWYGFVVVEYFANGLETWQSGKDTWVRFFKGQ
jgi:hypothetical protein